MYNLRMETKVFKTYTVSILIEYVSKLNVNIYKSEDLKQEDQRTITFVECQAL